MNNDKLRKLFEAAQCQRAPEPPAGFDARVLREIHREPVGGKPGVFDQLSVLFPRLAMGCAAILLICVVAEIGMAVSGQPDIESSAAQLSEQWLFAVRGF